MNGTEFDDDTFECSGQDDAYTVDKGGTCSNNGVFAGLDPDSGYNSDGTHVSMKASDGEPARPARQKCDTFEPEEFGEAARACKALCYEDLVLWVVRNPDEGKRDILAMEVALRHHKGVDNKPKPYVASLTRRHQADFRV
jgi:hypothetical protein